jgi:hypothetical protein
MPKSLKKINFLFLRKKEKKETHGYFKNFNII